MLGAGGDAAREWAQYERAALETGQAWRLLTAHLVHLNWGHVGLNVVALVLIALLFEDLLSPLDWLAATVLAALAIDLGLYVWNNDVQWYVGLSGVLHGYVVLGAAALAGERRGIGVTLALGVAGKLVWEQFAGPLPFTEAQAGGPVVVAAHLYGAAAGALLAAARPFARRVAARRHAL